MLVIPSKRGSETQNADETDWKIDYLDEISHMLTEFASPVLQASFRSNFLERSTGYP
jgi:hypothetical protein